MTEEGMAGSARERRRFLRWFIQGAAALMAAITVIPGVGMVLAPIVAGQRRRRRVLFRNPGDADAATFVAARYEGQEATAPGIFVRRLPNGGVEVLSARCTHAGCAVDWQAAENQFRCPCHGALYDANGKNVSGPAPRPLDHLPAERLNGDVMIEEPQA